MSLFGGREILVECCNGGSSNTLLGEIEMGMTSSCVSSQSVGWMSLIILNMTANDSTVTQLNLVKLWALSRNDTR